MWQSPPEKALVVESPCGGKRSGKEEEKLLQWFPRDWLAIDETFLGGPCAVAMGHREFPSHSGSCYAQEQRKRSLKGELVTSTVGIL